MTGAMMGWTCAACGWFVPNGAGHSCSGAPLWTPPAPLVSGDGQILAALTEVKLLLEKIHGELEHARLSRNR